jgi:uncharacterized protein (TIGR01777 family)
MRTIITGGTGLIGSALARSLVADGHEVIVLSRSPSDKKLGINGVQMVQWDGKSANGWVDVANGADAIVHLAGAGIADGRWTESRKQAIVQSRKESGAAVMDALRKVKQRPSVLVQASAVGYYGPRKSAEPVTEEAPPSTDWLGRVTFAWEGSTAEAPTMGVRRPVIRTGIVFSTEGGAFPKMKLPFDLLIAGGPLGSGNQYVPWIHIDDEVRAIRFLMENEAADGPFNLAAPNAVTYKEFANTMGEVMGRPSFMPAPSFALKAALGDMAQLLLTGQNQVPARLLEMGFSFTYPELKPALEALLNKQPVPA